jgi:hypothetical protein
MIPNDLRQIFLVDENFKALEVYLQYQKNACRLRVGVLSSKTCVALWFCWHHAYLAFGLDRDPNWENLFHLDRVWYDGRHNTFFLPFAWITWGDGQYVPGT